MDLDVHGQLARAGIPAGLYLTLTGGRYRSAISLGSCDQSGFDERARDEAASR